MKKVLLSVFTLTMFFTASAQCTPDASVQSGISPDTLTGMATAWTGMPYSEVFTFVVPQDTNFQGSNITIDNVTLDAINGLPANFNYACNPSDCVFPGGTSKCVEVYSMTDPTAADIGIYPLEILATPYALIFGFPVSQGQTTYESYKLVVEDAANMSIRQSESDLDLVLAYPNPANDACTIEFVLEQRNNVEVKVSNLLGEVVLIKEIAGTVGVNQVMLNTSEFNSGVYIYSISTGAHTVSRKLTVNR